MKKQKTKGYVIVASAAKNFYLMALNLAESILDFYPEANITLVTEERFVDGRCSHLNVIHCDGHYRAKLWGMSQTPYDITFYLDADMECEHEDISNVFDELGDNDMMFTPLLEETDYAFNNRHFPGGSFKLNGGVCLYDKTKANVLDFIIEWDRRYRAQRADSQYGDAPEGMFDTTEKKWWPTKEDGTYDYDNYPINLSSWDQFTLWWLTNKEKEFKDLKIGIFDDWARWNYYTRYQESKKHNKNPIVIKHYSSGSPKWEDLS